MLPYRWLVLSTVLFPTEKALACFFDADLELYGQVSYVHKKASSWEIEGKDPYSADNSYNDLALKYHNRCELIENKLSLNINAYGLAYSAYKDTGDFEQDNKHVKLLLDQLSLSYHFTDTLSLDAGKLKNSDGLFYLKSPTDLLNNYYAGFKPTRIHNQAMDQIYSESFWGLSLTQDAEDYSLAVTIAPKLTDIDERYVSSSNWSSLERSNSRDRYLFRYTDYHFKDHTTSVSLRLGDAVSVAFSNSYNISQQLVMNAEFAWHNKQQWRHLNSNNAQLVQNYSFPNDLYQMKKKDGFEVALGMQYTSDRFSQFGIEYYYQSEGYSKKQWNEQKNLIQFLNQRTNFAPLDSAFDSYKYLMASEIYNTSSQGNLMGRHYLNSYASILMADQSTIKPYVVMNLVDKSAISGITYTKPFNIRTQQVDIYTGIYAALGRNDSEFGLFGETVGTYVGFNYHF